MYNPEEEEVGPVLSLAIRIFVGCFCAKNIIPDGVFGPARLEASSGLRPRLAEARATRPDRDPTPQATTSAAWPSLLAWVVKPRPRRGRLRAVAP